MPLTYNLIASNTLGTSATSITFSSIPQTYTDLVLRISNALNGGGPANYWIKYSGVTSGVYSAFGFRAFQNPPDTISSPNQTELFAGWMPGNGYPNSRSNNEVYIPDYTAARRKQAWVANQCSQNTATAGEWYVAGIATDFNSSTAITSIQVGVSSPGFVADSSFYLYGIKRN